jgi:hypothetical protein
MVRSEFLRLREGRVTRAAAEKRLSMLTGDRDEVRSVGRDVGVGGRVTAGWVL